jgi:arsenate reductase
MRGAPWTGVRATVWYNPRCNTCRKVKAALEAGGAEVETVEYLKGKVTHDEWAALVDAVGGEPTKLLRSREPLYKDLKLEQKIAQGKIGRDQVIDLLRKHPQLLERPVVVTENCSFIARPAEKAQEVLR